MLKRNQAVAYASFNTYGRNNPQLDKMQKLRDLTAQLAGEEAQIAGQLMVALQEAETSGAMPVTRDRINLHLSRARGTFDTLEDELKSVKNLGGVRAQVVASLYCVMSDGVLFGYEGGCPTMVPGVNVPSVNAPEIKFGAGYQKSENVEARQVIEQIKRESTYFLQIANQFDEALIAMKGSGK
ncbi:MAG: hypothetical protein NDI90_02425 [Nitrospira sp. BO4]|jgi:hypothetical protein|nr:hypothetical protein [Nitrospira sp. BO4]